MERVKLLADKNEVVTVNGKYLFSVSITDRAKELLYNEGWDKGNESWLAYRRRTKQERINEELNREKIASDLVFAYNEKYGLQ